MTKLSAEELKAWGESFESKQPQDVLAAAIERYAPKIILACSFGAEDVVLVDMIHRINPTIPLFYLDTDFLFPETYVLRDRVIERYGLKPEQVIQMKSLLTPEAQAQQYGERLWAKEPREEGPCGRRPPPTLSREASRATLPGRFPDSRLSGSRLPNPKVSG